MIAAAAFGFDYPVPTTPPFQRGVSLPATPSLVRVAAPATVNNQTQATAHTYQRRTGSFLADPPWPLVLFFLDLAVINTRFSSPSAHPLCVNADSSIPLTHLYLCCYFRLTSVRRNPLPLLLVFLDLWGMELEQCLNSSECLPKKPKLVLGLKGSTANTCVDNAAYRAFLFKTFRLLIWRAQL